MKTKYKERKLLACSVLGFLMMSLSLLLMPVQMLGFLPGILFWVGLIAGVAGQILLALTLRECLGKSKGIRWGLLSFCTNPWAKVTDIGLLVSLLATVLILSIWPAAYICYVVLAVAVFCFCLHCIFHGRIYNYVMECDYFRRKPDQNNQ